MHWLPKGVGRRPDADGMKRGQLQEGDSGPALEAWRDLAQGTLPSGSMEFWRPESLRTLGPWHRE